MPPMPTDAQLETLHEELEHLTEGGRLRLRIVEAARAVVANTDNAHLWDRWTREHALVGELHAAVREYEQHEGGS